MFLELAAIALGVLLGWAIPQPAWAKDLIEKIQVLGLPKLIEYFGKLGIKLDLSKKDDTK